MKSLLHKIVDYSNQAIPYVLMVIVFFLSLYQQVAITAIVVLAVIWIFSGNYIYISNLFQKEKLPLLLMLIYWLLHLTSLIYTSNLSRGLFDIQQKLSFLLFPLVFATSGKVIGPKFRKILIAFILGLTLTGIVCLVKAFYLSFTSRYGVPIFNTSPIDVPWDNYFFYSTFTKPHHPTYFSMMFNFGICVLLWFIKIRDRKNKLLLYAFISLLIIFFSLILLASSRAGFLTLFFILIVGVIWLILKKLGGILKVIVFASLIIFVVQVGIQNERFSSLLRTIGLIEQSEQVDNEQEEVNETRTMVRLRIWKSIPSIVGNNWIFGFGVGDSKDELLKGYERIGLKHAKESSYNAHNQYLESFTAIGLLGLFVLITLIVVSFRKAYNSRNILLSLFLFIISMNMFFESIFERVAGVIFFATFFSLLLFESEEKIK